MFVKLTIGLWLVSTLIFFYFFIFDSTKDGEGAELRKPPTSKG